MDPSRTPALRSQSPRNSSSSSSFSSSSSSSADTSFPVLAISILGILTTAILLVSYYVFVIKCCMSWRHGDVLRRLISMRSRRRRGSIDGLPLDFFAAIAESHGLDEPTIQSIPTIRFRKQDGRPLHECAVCLSEFQEEEKLRLLPSCSHAFHVDCIDTWLQSSANCPLCRSDIVSPVSIPTPLIAARDTTPDDNQSTGTVVIEVREEISDQNPIREPSPRPREPRSGGKRGRKLRHGSSMGDECIDVRGKDEQFSAIQPMRRSFSMDSSCDRQLYLSVQEILQRSNQPREGGGNGEGCSSGGGGSGGAKIRRSFFSFGHGRSSRSAVLPVQIEP